MREPASVERLTDAVAAQLSLRMSAFNAAHFNPHALRVAARIAVETVVAELAEAVKEA